MGNNDNKLVNEYLDSLYKNNFHPSHLTDKDQLKQEIYSLLTPEWFRFRPIGEEIKNVLVKKISEAVERKKPIEALNAFGGFKVYRIDTSPHIDYAEIFHISFITQVLQRVCEIYEPGVHLEYSGDAYMACFVDNLKKEWVDTYLQEFDEVIKIFSGSLPHNLVLTCSHFSDFYDYDQLTQELTSIIANENMNDPKNSELVEKYLTRAQSNYCFNGLRDDSSLNENEKTDLLKRSVLLAYKYYDLDFERRGEYFAKFDVSFCNLQEFPGTYCVRSVRHQPAPPFWQGKGVAAIKNGKVEPIILHVNEYLKRAKDLIKVVVEKPLINTPSLSEISILPLETALS